jgi:hypothetical protein
MQSGTSEEGQSAAATFSKYLDNPGEAFAAVFPIRLKCAFGASGISGNDGSNDLLVLGYGGMQIVHDPAGVEPPVPFSLRLNGFVQGKEPWTRASLDDGAMKAVIRFENAGGGQRSLCGAPLRGPQRDGRQGLRRGQ